MTNHISSSTPVSMQSNPATLSALVQSNVPSNPPHSPGITGLLYPPLRAKRSCSEEDPSSTRESVLKVCDSTPTCSGISSQAISPPFGCETGMTTGRWFVSRLVMGFRVWTRHCVGRTNVVNRMSDTLLVEAHRCVLSGSCGSLEGTSAVEFSILFFLFQIH